MAKRRALEGAELERAATLRGEGMPASWIAEDLDCRRESLFRSGVRADPSDAAEWRRTWAYIRTRPELLTIHRLLQPDVQYRV